METINYDDFLDRYVHGFMAVDEKLWFEKELYDNPGLNSQLFVMKHMEEAINERDILDFREQLADTHEALMLARKRKRRLRIQLASAAAISVGVVILILALTFTHGKQYTNQEVYSMYFQPYQSTMTVRSGNEEGNAMFNQAINHYKVGEFREAIAIFDQIITEQQDNHAAKLYYGISNMEVKQFPVAEQSFQSIVNQGRNLYVQQAEWYKGLCYLMMNRRKEAIDHFQKIVNGKGYYKDLADEVLEKLR